MAITQLQEFTNNATTTVPAITTSGALSVTVATGTGSLFPVLSGSEYFIATMVNISSGDPGFGEMEIIKVTARSGDVMTILRAQEGSSAKSFPTNSLFELRPTAGAFNTLYTNLLQVQTDKADLASPVFTGDPTAPTPATGDNDTSIATTGYVVNKLATPTPIGSGTPNTGAFTTITASSTITPSQTAGIVGTTTNNNANAGSVGEYSSNSNAGTGVSTGVTTAITSVSLTPGDWDVEGAVLLQGTGGASLTNCVGGSSTSSTVFGGIGTYAQLVTGGLGSNGAWVSPIPTTRYSFSSTTTVYLLANAVFTSGGVTASGLIRARRVR